MASFHHILSRCIYLSSGYICVTPQGWTFHTDRVIRKMIADDFIFPLGVVFWPLPCVMSLSLHPTEDNQYKLYVVGGPPSLQLNYKFKFSAKEISSFVSLLKVLIRQTLANVFFTKACVLIIPTWAFSACFVSIQLVSSSALKKSLNFHHFSTTNLYAQRVFGCCQNPTQLNSSWFDHIMGIVTHPPPTHGKLLDHFQTTQEADFRHATLF